MEISLDLVTEAARRRLAAVTPEVAGYIVLLATRALEERLFRVSAANFALSETGEVRAHPEGRMSESEVEAALRDLLASLLSLSPSPSPAVVAVASRAESTGLRALTAELTAALIPINHAAAQRALARLFRETRRAREFVQTPVGPAPGERALEGAGQGRAIAGAPHAASTEDELDIDVEIDAGPPSLAPTAGGAESVARADAASPTPSSPTAGSPTTASPTSAAPTSPSPSDSPASPSIPAAANAIAPPPSADLDEPERPLELRAADMTVSGIDAGADPVIALEVDIVGTDVRSDLDTLLGAFLAHTRSEEAMRLALRRLVGLEPRLEPAL
jgi:hypothetical protein